MARPEDDNQTIPAPAEITGDRVTITAPEPDDDADDQPAETPQAAADRARDERGRFSDRPVAKPTRKDRRQGYQPNPELVALREQVGRIPDMLRQHEQTWRAEIDRIRTAAQPAAPAQPSVSPEMAEVQTAMSREMQLMQKHDPSNGPFDLTRWNQLQDRKAELIAEAMVKKHLVQQPRQPQRDGMPPEYRVRYDHLKEQYPELETNEQFVAMVRHERNKLLAARRPDTLTTDLEACARIAAELGLRQRQPARGNQQMAVRRQGPPGGNEAGSFGNRPQSMEVPAKFLRGLNLPEELIRKATFGPDGEG
jgi:hypothetical protein